LTDIQRLFTSVSESPERKKDHQPVADHRPISTLLANVEAEFHRREQEKKTQFLKWVNEGRILNSSAPLIA
jgi:hypothetical protein